VTAHTPSDPRAGIIGPGDVGPALVVEHASRLVDLRDAGRHRLGGPPGALPASVDVR
jgi:hypothetical protein